MCNFSLDRTQPRGYLSFPSFLPSPLFCLSLSLSPNQPGVGLMPPRLHIFISSLFIHSSTLGVAPASPPSVCLSLYGRQQQLLINTRQKLKCCGQDAIHLPPPPSRTNTWQQCLLCEANVESTRQNSRAGCLIKRP